MSTFGSIWPNLSMTPSGPKSGEHDDQIAPIAAVASIAITANDEFGISAATLSPDLTPSSSRLACTMATLRASSAQVILSVARPSPRHREDHLGRTRPESRHGAGQPRGTRGQIGRQSCGTDPELIVRRDRNARYRRDRSNLVVVLARFRSAWRHRQVRPDRAKGAHHGRRCLLYTSP